VQDLLRLVRRKAWFFFAVGLAGLGLRLLFVLRFPGIVDDSRLYANIAENWLMHGVYGITNSGAIMPTLSRLPGYPAFLAAIFFLFGDENFRAVLLVQTFVDLATCFLIADLARRCLSERAASGGFLLAAICPFLANYAATALTETLEIFFTALALDLALSGLAVGDGQMRSDVRSDVRSDAGLNAHGDSRPLVWLGCGLSIGAAILLRPDGGILIAVVLGYLCWLLLRGWVSKSGNFRSIVWAAALVVAGATLPLIPWTLRNLHTLHRFEPLAPRYANDSDEPVMPGFNRWAKTWMADYVSVEEIYWNVPDQTIDVSRLPSRAFDHDSQKTATTELFADYNRDHDMTPELDARFGDLAAERVRAAPLRYYLWLPAVRIADMWLRPRTELFPSDPRWWEFNDDRRWLAVSLGFGLVNLAYVGMAAAGLLRAREVHGIGLLVLFLVLRSLFLGTLENPEPRYTLECYPAVIVLASALFRR
jgi:4-amino-4-deoxy-L-arabinose transferase-like glycosyltransferase